MASIANENAPNQATPAKNSMASSFPPASDAFTDFYELTMMQSYLEEGLHGTAVFELFVRRLPEERNYLIACGLEDALSFVETFRFSSETLRYLASLSQFSDSFLAALRDFRFSGKIYAVPEGTPVFANEPILQVEAPIREAQFFEAALINIIQFQTMIASKAHRVVKAAAGRPVVDFGARRIHGFEAALRAARAFHIAGAAATSNVMAGRVLGIPVSGTMAHSFIESIRNEYDAFEAFTRSWPETTLLVDTYDTLEGVRNVIRLKQNLGDQFRVKAIRLDSGDLGELAQQSRALLDDAGLENVSIFASSSLDEHVIDRLIRSGAPIDGFGVGTKMGVSEDAPSLDSVYKLAAYDGEGRMKLSTDKRTLPGLKQIYRSYRDGRMAADTLARWHEEAEGRPLVQVVMEGGTRTTPRRTLDEIRQYAAEAAGQLPPSLLSLEKAQEPYPVRLSEELERYTEEVAAGIKQGIRG